MTEYKQVRIPVELAQAAEVEAAATGRKRVDVLEDAIRRGLGGEVNLVATRRMKSQPEFSHPNQTLSTPLKQLSKESTEIPTIDQVAARYCITNGHLYAAVHGYYTGNVDQLKCVDVCARCRHQEYRLDCEVWSWCVSEVRWAELEKQRAVEAERILDESR